MRFKFHLLISLFIVSGGISTQAGLLRVESETFSSARQNDERLTELPFYENLSASYTTAKRDFEFNSNFSLFAEPTQKTSQNQASVHLLDIKFQAIPDFMQVRMGRTFDTQQSIGASSLDLLATDFYFLGKQLQLGAFVGTEKKMEYLTPSANLWGVHANYFTNDTLPYLVATKFIQRLNNNTLNPTENLLQLSGKKTFEGSWSPEVVFDSQTNITKSNTDRIEAGLDLYPSIYSYTKIRALTYDVLPNTGVEQPIYSIFSEGRLYETRFQYQYKINAKLITAVSLFYDNYKLEENKRAYGYGSEIEIIYLSDIGRIDNTLYTFTSYGGKVLGNRILLQNPQGLKNEIYILADVTYYEKITSSKRTAINTELGWSKTLSDNLKLNFGGELNSNNISLYDFRAFAKLTYFLWSET